MVSHHLYLLSLAELTRTLRPDLPGRLQLINDLENARKARPEANTYTVDGGVIAVFVAQLQARIAENARPSAGNGSNQDADRS